ncbi:IS66 family insertion sequence element accessory protein TnpB [Segatella asaccharophila]
MRKGISSLCGVVHEKMNSNVRNGDVFIFIGRSRKLMKLLHAEDGGMVIALWPQVGETSNLRSQLSRFVC